MRARRYVHIIIGVLLGGLLLSGCKPDEPTQQMAMPISICLPAGEIYTSMWAPELRAFGDPGTTEQFALPNYIYIYIVKYKGAGDKETPTNWIVWEIITKSIEDESGTAEEKKAAWEAKWEKKHYVGLYDTEGDDVYEYTETVNQEFGNNGFDGRVYVVASAVALTFNSEISKDANAPSTLADLLDLSFSFSGSTAYDNKVKANLQNIYSTPYNYKGGGADYYGSFYVYQKVPQMNILLYHVAAKVDLMWNVKEELRSSVKINYIAAENLYNGPCLVFRPTENQLENKEGQPEVLDEQGVYIGGYTHELLTTLSPGTQWNGRAYFYAIPYRNNNSDTGDYPLKLKLYKNGDSGDTYYTETVPTEVGGTWTSWIRGQITINTADYNYPPSTP